MKDFLESLHKFGITGLVTGIGWISVALIAMSLYQPLSFIPKFFVLFVLTH